MLLGLIHEGEGVAAQALESLGIGLEAVRQQVEEVTGLEWQAVPGRIPFTPRAKKVLELARREAFQLGHHYIGTEHILLGLIREGEGVGAQVLAGLGADLNRVRKQVIRLLHGAQGKDEPMAARAVWRRSKAGARQQLARRTTRARRCRARRFQQVVASDTVKARAATLFAQGLQTRGPLELDLGDRIGYL